MRKEIAVIGGGPAGIEAARSAALAGARVILISDTPLGGRAGWHSLVPSKVWLHAADVFGTVADAPTIGIAIDGARPDPAAVLARIGQVAQAWNSRLADELRGLGVRFLTGTAAFTSPTTLQVEGEAGAQAVAADAIIVATGSVPVFPPTMRPDGKRVLAPRFASKLAALPGSIVVVGGGATGSEFAYLFNRLGVNVTWIVDDRGVLPMFAPDAGAFLGEVLAQRGVTLRQGPRAMGIETRAAGVTVTLADESTVDAEMAFLAVGRRADVSRLGVEHAGIAPDANGALTVDAVCRTAVPTVYAVGDVTGAPMLANQAVRQAQVAARHAAGASTSPYRPETVIHAIYAEPQVAQVGATDGALASVRIPFHAGLKAHLLVAGGGYLDLFYGPDDRRVAGAVAVGPHAADALGPVALAIHVGTTVEELAAPAGAYPTVGELAFVAAARVA